MRLRWYRRPRRGSLPRRSLRRWILVGLGLGVLVVALTAAVGPYRQTREFRQVVACDRDAGDCFGRGPASIAGRRTYLTTTTHTDANGTTSTTTTTHFEVTWQRTGGARQTREVSSDFFAKAREGEPATLRLWHDEVVGVEVMGGAQWFLPESGTTLGHWLYLAFFGLGMLLWGLLFGWWDGLFMLAFRTFAWMFMGVMPVNLATDALAYGLDTGAGLVMDIAIGVFFAGIAGGMLFASLDSW
ncbi:hypothetical protein [Sphaerisporangium corydalis]|uniref:DUF3592 domain-containing protein n=1 Tax=Sphaerisporangium corydalis TaxID=1441875 RepID=A0ABV9EF57_9ACTN|nr:hypothetical protein [Sphaerisporangium corydalis]